MTASKTFGTVYPQNMIADMLGISENEIPYEDVEETAEELLDILPRELVDIVLRRYKNQEGYSSIAKSYNSFAASIRSKINTAFHRMKKYKNGWVLQYGCEYLEKHRIVTEETLISNLSLNTSTMSEIESAYMFTCASNDCEIDSYEYEELKGFIRVMDLIRMIRAKAFEPRAEEKIKDILYSYGFTVSDVYGEDYEDIKAWSEFNPSVSGGHWDFPFNLIHTVFGEKNYASLDDMKNGMSEYEALCSVYHVLGMLDEVNPRYSKILLMRFRDKMTLEQVGTVIGRNKERIRQIEVKALRMLRHPTMLQFLKTGGYSGYVERLMKEEKEYHGRIERAYKAKLKRLSGTEDEMDLTSEDPEDIDITEKVLKRSIEDMDLSVRAFNVLKRSGCNTVEDVLAAFKCDRIISMRNMGRKSAEEIEEKMIAMGFKKEDLEYDGAFSEIYYQKKEEEAEERKAKEEKAKREKEEEELKEAISMSREISGRYFKDAVAMMSNALRGLYSNERVIGIILRTVTEERGKASYAYGDPFRAYIRDVTPMRHMVELENSILECLDGIYKENYQILMKSDGLMQLPYLRVTGSPVNFNKIPVENIGFPSGLLGKLKDHGYETSEDLVKGLKSENMEGITDQEKKVIHEFLTDMGYPLEMQKP